jgi:glycosyltransferase involved in cell wall biosynthesis
MPREDLLAKMRSCDIFLFTSLRDGGGLVVVEAMASGKPVVCLDLAGPAFHVTEECGIKIPARSPKEAIELTAQALERLYRDHELSEKMGEAGRARAEQVYTWDRLGERVLGLYEEVLGATSQEA